jgi:mannosyltransferase OCH1-like enzyme
MMTVPNNNNNSPHWLTQLLLLMAWSMFLLNRNMIAKDHISLFSPSLLQGDLEEGAMSAPVYASPPMQPHVHSKNSSRKDPMQEIMELSESLHMTERQGSVFCSEAFPNSTIPLYYVEDRVVVNNTLPPRREGGTINVTTHPLFPKIPMMIHMTSETRCVSKPLLDNINTWKEEFPHYSFFLHDSPARERFFQETHNDAERHLGFPYMTLIRPCLKDAGATVSDIWRYMFLFHYGGMYVDMDDGPGELLRTTIDRVRPLSEAMVLQHMGKTISQSFFMVAPRHALMHFAILEALSNLLSLKAVGSQYIPYTTGPEALGIAYHKFMGVYGIEPPTSKEDVFFWKVGHFVGHGNWSVDVISGYKEKQKYLKLYVVDEDQKKEYYTAVNSKIYQRIKHLARRDRSDMTSCFGKIVDALAAASQSVVENS